MISPVIPILAFPWELNFWIAILLLNLLTKSQCIGPFMIKLVMIPFHWLMVPDSRLGKISNNDGDAESIEIKKYGVTLTLPLPNPLLALFQSCPAMSENILQQYLTVFGKNLFYFSKLKGYRGIPCELLRVPKRLVSGSTLLLLGLKPF